MKVIDLETTPFLPIEARPQFSNPDSSSSLDSHEASSQSDDFRRLCHKLPELVSIFSGPGHQYEFVNEAFIEAFGFDPTGMQMISAHPGAGEVLSVLDEVLKTGKTRHLREIAVTLGSQIRFFDVILLPRINSCSTGGIMALASDVTNRLQTGKRMDLKQGEALSSTQLQSNFLAKVSHEIRTPMTSVLGFVEVLRDPSLPDRAKQDALWRIERSSRSLLRLIDDLLEFSKTDRDKASLQKSRFSPAELASDILALLRSSAEAKGLELKLKVDSRVPSWAYADSLRLKQILVHIVENAIKFTHTGWVCMSIKTEDDKFLVFDVADTGIGIAAKDQEILFRPFAQADESISRRNGGTGMGLALAKSLCTALGGTLLLSESRMGQGSRFTAKFEATPFISRHQKNFIDEREVPTLSQSQRRDSPNLKGLTILVAEDMVDNQLLIRRYLEGAGATVKIATNGEEVISMARSLPHHLIVMDIQMPVVDGLRATKYLRGQGYSRPILALTAHALPEEALRSHQAGCDAHLIKPISRKNLLCAIVKAAEKV